jgi:hypothetical protein
MYSPDDLRQVTLDDPHTWLVASARYFQELGWMSRCLRKLSPPTCN